MLLGKWGWGLMVEKESLRCKVIVSKYGSREGPATHKERMGNRERGRSSIWWRDLCKYIISSDWFEDNVAKKTGEGDGTSFWFEKWIGDNSLALSFNRLFRIASDKDWCIKDKGIWVENKWEWKWSWRREFFEWEKESFSSLLSLIDKFTPTQEKKDRWKWKAKNKGIYSSKSAYKETVKKSISRKTSSEFLENIWCNLAPSQLLFVGNSSKTKSQPDKIYQKEECFARTSMTSAPYA